MAAVSQGTLAMLGPPEAGISEEWVDVPRYAFDTSS